MPKPPEKTPDLTASVHELGLVCRLEGDRVVGDLVILPEMWVPGTQVLRTSVLAVAADMVAGFSACFTQLPNIPVTLDLDLHLHRQLVGLGVVTVSASVVKAGRRIVVTTVDISIDGETVGIATGSFMISPDPEHVTEGEFDVTSVGSRRRLRVPFAERAGLIRIGPGVVEVPKLVENTNSTGSIQGGLVALAVEEAVLTLAPGTVLTSVSLRYLRPYHAGPARATARLVDGLAVAEVAVQGTDKLGSLATARYESATT